MGTVVKPVKTTHMQTNNKIKRKQSNEHIGKKKNTNKTKRTTHKHINTE